MDYSYEDMDIFTIWSYSMNGPRLQFWNLRSMVLFIAHFPLYLTEDYSQEKESHKNIRSVNDL